jgi:hypothetical protein
MCTSPSPLDYTSATFRAAFPEFKDEAAYPDGQVNMWLDVAKSSLNPSRWGNMLAVGYGLYVAHNIVQSKQAQDTVDLGGTPGDARGPITSETPGAVSISYDASAITLEGGGNYNATSYGQRFLYLARIRGTGGLQSGTPGPARELGGGLGAANAWYGPVGYLTGRRGR